jgi:purine-nucleoside phosphorylase
MSNGVERWDAARTAADALRGELSEAPTVAVTLGSGMSAALRLPEEGTVVPWSAVPGFPEPTVEGHAGTFWCGSIGDRSILIQQGRTHYYEGYGLDEVTFATRMFAALGVRTLIVTNASGAIGTHLTAGDLVLITDHINMLGANPLRGPNLDAVGPRFPDMSFAYSPRLRDLARRVAGELGIALKEGVYVAALGPSYETPAEIRAYGRMGADLVGMSTVPEVIVAVHAGMEVLGLSCATNLAAGVDPEAALSHDEVIETTQRKGEELGRLILSILRAL